MKKGDISMKTAGEIIQYINETSANVYELSKDFGLAETTLRSRLIKLGFEVSKEGVWQYAGDPDKEPVDEDVVSKMRMTASKESRRKSKDVIDFSKPTIHQTLMQLDLTKKSVRTTITIQPEYMEEMKKLATNTRLRLSDLYTLAIYEFLDKYYSDEK